MGYIECHVAEEVNHEARDTIYNGTQADTYYTNAVDDVEQMEY